MGVILKRLYDATPAGGSLKGRPTLQNGREGPVAVGFNHVAKAADRP